MLWKTEGRNYSLTYVKMSEGAKVLHKKINKRYTRGKKKNTNKITNNNIDAEERNRTGGVFTWGGMNDFNGIKMNF